ncbi:hypothetical protein COLO4_13089 [Corchorus olitorius]|uniref:PLAC8 motif-containing protein n=1 Tax=Corchorus olitorius TaxID=93759 RepID=A0A1R3JY82_9ROSI|nr:hypothetical protein COLO4_13089 [Corchorus olitorius]
MADWSTGLFDCFSDCSLSCGGNCLLYLLVHHVSGCLITILFGYFHRRTLRRDFGLKSSPCPDFCVHCFCHYCALCQEYRELQNHGFDMKIGYDANVQKQQNRGVTMAPMNEEGMKR